MIVGYYILPLETFHSAAKEDPFQACAHQIDDTHVICWARFPDHGHEQRFLSRQGVEALPDARRSEAIHKTHVARLAKYGVEHWHSTLDVSDRLVEVAGHCMKLPSS
jgi:hypothetical protein